MSAGPFEHHERQESQTEIGKPLVEHLAASMMLTQVQLYPRTCPARSCPSVTSRSDTDPGKPTDPHATRGESRFCHGVAHGVQDPARPRRPLWRDPGEPCPRRRDA